MDKTYNELVLEWAKGTIFPCCLKCRNLHIRYDSYESGKGSKAALCYKRQVAVSCPAWIESNKTEVAARSGVKPQFPITSGPPMIDVAMTNTSVLSSPVISEIDNSWREVISGIRDGVVKFPFDGEYEAIVMKYTVSVQGYRGPWKIDKIMTNGTTLKLKRPIKVKDFRVFGVFDKKGKFLFYRVLPLIGFHFHGADTGDMIPQVCVGDMEAELANPQNMEQLKANCLKIVKSQEVINTGSIGNTHLPKHFDYIMKNINRVTINRITRPLL